VLDNIFNAVEHTIKEKNQVTPQQKQQALQLYSQYLESLNKPNTNPLLQNNQKEQVKKFKELQERLSNKEFLEGAKTAWESTSALQELGTQEEYNDYIARVSLGILKNPSSGEYNYTSQVKDIVYHGTRNQFAEFRKTNIAFLEKLNIKLNRGTYFSTNKEHANYLATVDSRREGMVISALLNLKNPYEPLWDYVLFNSKKYDGLINYNKKDQNFTIDEFAVFEPEQIHILGGKQDIEGFKEFVGKGEVEKKPRINYEKFINLKPSSKITKEEWKELTQEEQEVLMFQAENC
jgi:hypothetical protein